jgi:hypothetical protein
MMTSAPQCGQTKCTAAGKYTTCTFIATLLALLLRLKGKIVLFTRLFMSNFHPYLRFDSMFDFTDCVTTTCTHT